MDPKYSDIEKAPTDDMFTMRYILVVGGMLLAALSMTLGTCSYAIHTKALYYTVPSDRMKYCLDTGHTYVWDVQTNGVTCK